MTAVRYHSRGGNTRKLAEAIASAAGVRAQDCSVPLDGPADLLFVGGALYAGKIDASLRDFLASLTPEQVGRVAVFSTSMTEAAILPEVQALLGPKGIAVDAKYFHCKGKFLFFNGGRPNAQDLEQAAAFAKSVSE